MLYYTTNADYVNQNGRFFPCYDKDKTSYAKKASKFLFTLLFEHREDFQILRNRLKKGLNTKKTDKEHRADEKQKRQERQENEVEQHKNRLLTEK